MAKGPITSQFKERIDDIVEETERRHAPELAPHQLELEEYLAELQSRHGGDPKRAVEYLDSTPMAPPLGYKRQPSLSEQIREMVRHERLQADLAAQGVETFDEADDFSIGDDFDPKSPFEEHFDPIPVSELREREKKAAEADSGGSGGTPPPKPAEPAGAPPAEPVPATPPQPLPPKGK